VPNDETAIGGEKRAFQSTLWTVVLAAKDPASADRRSALQRLIESYWKPVYLFIRRRGNDVESSKDLAQGFFTAPLERNFLQDVQRDVEPLRDHEDRAHGDLRDRDAPSLNYPVRGPFRCVEQAGKRA